MLNKTDINKIKSDYILKSLFTYIDYLKILKIVQKNKRLKNRLDISLDSYKERSDFPKYEYYKSEVISRKKIGIGGQEFAELFLIIISSCCACILFIYSIIYSILLVSLDSFDDSNTKENYNKSSVNIINKINALTFILDGVIISTPFIFIFYLFKKLNYDYGIKKIVKSFIIIIINIAHFSFEGLIIWKLVLSYKIKKDDVTWFMVMDYIFIILNFIYIIYIIFFSLIFFADSGIAIEKTKILALTSFNGIKIHDYTLPNNFEKWNKKERKKYVLNNYHKYEYSISRSQRNLIRSINNFRKLKGFQRLKFDDKNKIPEFIINKPSILLLNSSDNIFKLSTNIYLFKYPKGIFESKFDKQNEKIINIISNENLAHIQIISQRESEYIMLKANLLHIPFIYRSNSSLEEEDNLSEGLYDDDYTMLNIKYNFIIHSSQNKYFE